MMNRIILVFLLLMVVQGTMAQEVTTFILVRHAEKGNDGTKDPDLSEAGKNRAATLVKLLQEVKVDAIYSTNYKRTRNTVTPLAAEKKLTIASYDAMKGEEIDLMLNKFKGGTVVICGHSNTTPWVANYLSGTNQYKDFDDSDYDNVILIDVLEKGKVKATWLTY
jgi:2,3-bisphosphoglycerate-dependent phosphoglycerate mutase